ncbi:hypothetical protein [Streptomyces sp. NPDC000229]|uniref:hypothetical protein n=1 Tax=Streptomyces sp. NPDC000229 TaxID=3154247 RepID=UPI00331671EA
MYAPLTLRPAPGRRAEAIVTAARPAAQAATAANALRRADWLMPLPAEAARTWLRGQYQQHTEDDDPHPPNCPGGCRGSGWVIEPVIWQNDGIPVHAEPVACLRGEDDDRHAADCTRCHGTGKQYDAERSEYTLCSAFWRPAVPVGAAGTESGTGAQLATSERHIRAPAPHKNKGGDERSRLPHPAARQALLKSRWPRNRRPQPLNGA